LRPIDSGAIMPNRSSTSEGVRNVEGVAVVVMPGIRNLGNREFLRAFQEVDRIIQRGHPVFGLGNGRERGRFGARFFQRQV
jgi:hypothetical protein